MADSVRLLLKLHGIKIDKDLIREFLEGVDEIAPWFLHTGSLSLTSWGKLGRDIEEADKHGGVPPMVKPIHCMLRSCLEEEYKGPPSGLNGPLDQIRLELQKARSESGSEPNKDPQKETLETDSSDEEEDNSRDLMSFELIPPRPSCPLAPSGGDQATLIAKPHNDDGPAAPSSGNNLYPTLNQLRKKFPPQPDPPASIGPFPPWDYPWQYTLPPLPPRPCGPPPPPPATTPPPAAIFEPVNLPEPPKQTAGPLYGDSFHAQTWMDLRADDPAFFPVQVTGGIGGGPAAYTPLDFKSIKALKESVHHYGPAAPYTLAVLDSVASQTLTPTDWQTVARAVLTAGDYVNFKAWNEEFCQEQERCNQRRNRRGITLEMLLGKGQHANAQTTFPQEAYEQINACALKAWKQLVGPSGSAISLTRLLQGPNEPFCDFVAKVQQAAERTLGDSEATKPLVKQLIFEQANKECKDLLRGHRHEDIDAWIRLCRDTGAPLTATQLMQGITQAMLAMQNTHINSNNKGKNSPIKCHSCGRLGHIRRNCPSSRGDRLPSASHDSLNSSSISQQNSTGQDLCQRCRKGPHPASQCRSIFDIDGKRLSGSSKNGQRGSLRQGDPQFPQQPLSQNKTQTQFQSAQEMSLEAQPPWTSVPPPQSY